MKYNVTHGEVNLERMLAFYEEEYQKNPCHNFYMLGIIKKLKEELAKEVWDAFPGINGFS